MDCLYQLDIDPDALIPKLPSPKDLQPFPTHQSISYEGHIKRIRCLSVHSSGLYVVSGSDDHTVRLWEVVTGRCLFTWHFEDVIHAIAWNPNPDIWLFAVSVGHGQVLLVSPPKLRTGEQAMTTDQFVKSGFTRPTSDDEKAKSISWEKPSENEEEHYGFKVRLQHTQAVKQITWHRKGDYFATVAPEAGHLAVLIHQTTKHMTQTPFRKLKGMVQKVAFHPVKPIFFLAVSRKWRMAVGGRSQ